MSRKTVLYICHNHPSVRPGGAENYAYELFSSFDECDAYDSVFLAKGGPPVGYSGRQHEGTLIAPVGVRPDDYFIYTDGYAFDWLNGSVTDKDFYSHHLANFLLAVQPDVVHVQHSSFLGYDMLRAIRNTLPDAAIVYTLHEYMPICHRDGQMLRTRGNEPCLDASPRRCHECFPEITPQQFFLRKKFIQSHLALVDRFIAPSQFLIERYVDWGIPRERILFEENGRSMPPRVDTQPRPQRDRFGFFGQVSAYKGLDVLLDAFRLLAERRAPVGRAVLPTLFADPNSSVAMGPQPHLFVHGANLELQSGDYQERIRALLSATQGYVTSIGRYEARQLPALMAAIDWVVIPSIWWENSPLVIQEAFAHGRPIICSDIGGMAEKVVSGLHGLHFRAGDSRELADVIDRAASSPTLWDSLHRRLPAIHSMDAHRDRLVEVYDELVDARAARELSRAG
jgi:glycosyltransferase involved in cell wall biosynthesis